MLVTVLVTNHNYGRFLRTALDSALGQAYEPVEVLVVDDGSTDESHGIIASYRDRVVPVFQQNAGQGAAINAGIRASTGEVVSLLDADDAFRPGKLERIAGEFRDPSVDLVYHQIQPVGADGASPIGKPVPRAVWQGDIRKRVARSGGWWPRPPTSALTFRRSFLERVLPVPTDARQSWVDTYLAGLAPFSGSVVGIREPLAILRLHGNNIWSQGSVAGGDVLFRTRRDQYRAEFQTLVDALQNKLGVDAELLLDDHLRFQQYRHGSGEAVSRWEVTRLALRCPSLPWSMRWREATRIAIGRW